MKRIAFLVCGILLLLSNTAEARRNRWSRNANYTTTYNTTAPAAYAPVAPAAYSAPATTSAETSSTESTSAETTAAVATAVDYSTRTAQGVANLMAANNRVGHWGGNPGYEGCGCGATPQAAYNICCYGNSGMATVDVGYAKSRSGMWYCCRRYR